MAITLFAAGCQTVPILESVQPLTSNLVEFGCGYSQEAIELRLHGPELTYVLGTPLMLELSVTNSGDEATYVELTHDLGPGALNVVATREGCSYAVDPAFFDQPVEDLRFDFVALQPGSSHRFEMVGLNVPGQGLYLDLPGPGAYTLTATFTSDGAPIEGVIWPVWRGTVESAPLTIQVIEPSAEVIAGWRQRLEACVGAVDGCEDLAAMEYFRFVRAAGVGDLLRELLEKDPLRYSPAGTALVHQQNEQEVEFLEALIRDPALDQNHRVYYREFLEELEHALDGCAESDQPN